MRKLTCQNQCPLRDLWVIKNIRGAFAVLRCLNMSDVTRPASADKSTSRVDAACRCTCRKRWDIVYFRQDVAESKAKILQPSHNFRVFLRSIMPKPRWAFQTRKFVKLCYALNFLHRAASAVYGFLWSLRHLVLALRCITCGRFAEFLPRLKTPETPPPCLPRTSYTNTALLRITSSAKSSRLSQKRSMAAEF